MPLTFNEREERFIEYLTSLDREQAIELKCDRLGRVADLRKKLMALLNQIIEERAESLAAALVAGVTEQKRLAVPNERPETGWRKGRPFGVE